MTFHVYGFLVGLAIVSSILLVEYAVKKWIAQIKNTSKKEVFKKNTHTNLHTKDMYLKDTNPLKVFWWLAGFILIFGVIGARLWHGLTDYELYQNNFLDLLYFHQGGMSIIGAILGGLVGLKICVWYQTYRLSLSKKQTTTHLFFWLDAIILGVPVGQIIGRLGNWYNQELYGLPTQLPWAIYIEEAYRLEYFASFSTYHPLFAYEMILLLPLVLLSWWIFLKNPLILGSGVLFSLYGAWYGIGRFLLEFLRIQKTTLSDFSSLFSAPIALFQLGINQVFLLFFGLVSIFGFICLVRSSKQQYLSFKKRGVVSVIFVVTMSIACIGIIFARLENNPIKNGRLAAYTSSHYQSKLGDLRQVRDNTIVPVSLKNLDLEVEVVTSPRALALGLGGRQEIGSDGMLFVFPHPNKTAFWMIGMYMDLDLIWIKNGVVTGTTEFVSAPSAEYRYTQNVPRYHSPGIIDMVLEVPAGFSQENQILKGDRLTIK